MRKIAGVILLLLLGGSLQAERYLFKLPVNVGAPVNSEWNERDPFVTADGGAIFFCSTRPGGFGSLDVWMSVWNSSSWSAPVNCGPNVNSDLIEWSPSVSPDGKKLFFLAFGRPGGQGGWDVWFSDWDSASQQWGTAQNLGTVINTFATDWSPTLSYDGQSLFYATNGFLHPRGQALYFSRRINDAWTVPESLPYFINNTGTEEHPSVTGDEKTLYFNRINTVPSIFATGKDSLGQWSQPFELDSLINNSSFGNGDPAITPDGQKLYFVSGRPGGVGSPGSGDIWVADRTIPGDLNLDGEISTSDVVLELNKVFLGQAISAPEGAADLNCDNLLTASDVVLLLNRAFLNKPFPC